MTKPKPLFADPVENQVRELDPKLLLACVASAGGFPRSSGPAARWKCSSTPFRAASICQEHDVRSLCSSGLRQIRHDIITGTRKPWCTCRRRPTSRPAESCGHPLRQSPFRWAKKCRAVAPVFTSAAGIPIHVTGNRAATCCGRKCTPTSRRGGKNPARLRYFILINTIQPRNAFGPDMNLFKPVKKLGRHPVRPGARA